MALASHGLEVRQGLVHRLMMQASGSPQSLSSLQRRGGRGTTEEVLLERVRLASELVLFLWLDDEYYMVEVKKLPMQYPTLQKPNFFRFFMFAAVLRIRDPVPF
jgi:hypothetical protein